RAHHLQRTANPDSARTDLRRVSERCSSRGSLYPSQVVRPEGHLWWHYCTKGLVADAATHWNNRPPCCDWQSGMYRHEPRTCRARPIHSFNKEDDNDSLDENPSMDYCNSLAHRFNCHRRIDRTNA